MAKNIPVIKSLFVLSSGYPCAMKIQTFIYPPLVLIDLHDLEDWLASVVGKAGMGGKGL